ncbi:hypothetical protein [Ottowia sp. VDI28]|uniref:hypothetical protein n=1 Tax=Ottowia sp. VDI28 TaxID=3133968 RepID=UPI003C2F2094
MTAKRLSIKETVLAQFIEAEIEVLAIVNKYRNVAYAVTTPKGMKEAIAARADLRDNGRLMITKTAARVKTEVNELKRVMDGEVERIVGLIKPHEDAVDAQIKVEEQRKAEDKAERERKEAERTNKHRENLEKLKSYVERAQGQPIDLVERAIETIAALEIGAEWEEFQAAAAAEKQATLTALRNMVANEKQRLDNERLQRELAEAKALLAAQSPTADAAPHPEVAPGAQDQAMPESDISTSQPKESSSAALQTEKWNRDLQNQEQGQARVARYISSPVYTSNPVVRVGRLNPTTQASDARDSAADSPQRIVQELEIAPVAATTTPAAAPIDDGARINLGGIKKWIAPLDIDAVGLGQLGFTHVATEKASKLYRMCDLPAIRAAMVKHLEALPLPIAQQEETPTK